ncbi:MAG: porin [Planctomycetaceae bacterium]
MFEWREFPIPGTAAPFADSGFATAQAAYRTAEGEEPPPPPAAAGPAIPGGAPPFDSPRFASPETTDDRSGDEKTSDSSAEKPAPEKPAEKKWYDKYRVGGYAQFRFNETTHLAPGSAPPQHAGDSSVSDDETFIIRRARLIFSGDISDHLFVYLQPDFAASVPGSPDANHFVQIRDWYGDVYLDKEKVNRFRVGQSKVPYGWENLQSSSRRAPFDRNDAFNSATRNERDLGVFYYWTPEYVQDVFEYLSDNNLKDSGNYGAFGTGIYAGQGGSLREQNDNVHFVSRFTWPFMFENRQVVELGIQGYTGEYTVLGSPIRPLGIGSEDIVPLGTRDTGGRDGHLDQRLGWSFIWYPQPLGFQAEWTIGRGPALNDTQTAIETRALYGGYAMFLYKLDSSIGTWFPFIRWQYFQGGYKSFRNAPYSKINELELGIEWQIRKEMELTLMYTFTDRTNLDAMAGAGRTSYDQFDGQLVRVQFQVNY